MSLIVSKSFNWHVYMKPFYFDQPFILNNGVHVNIARVWLLLTFISGTLVNIRQAYIIQSHLRAFMWRSFGFPVEHACSITFWFRKEGSALSSVVFPGTAHWAVMLNLVHSSSSVLGGTAGRGRGSKPLSSPPSISVSFCFSLFLSLSHPLSPSFLCPLHRF